jgi:hypothetical protein
MDKIILYYKKGFIVFSVMIPICFIIMFFLLPGIEFFPNLSKSHVITVLGTVFLTLGVLWLIGLMPIALYYGVRTFKTKWCKYR